MTYVGNVSSVPCPMRKGVICLIGSLVYVLGACDQAPDATGQWAAAEHDREPAQQQGQQTAPTGSNKPTVQQQLVDVAWRQCASCHGPLGHGDGPNGALVKAADLTSEEWQAKVTDEEIATRIRSGKGLMPPNDLPDSTIRGLVGRIRTIRGMANRPGPTTRGQ
jgi:mono/diheme cytochrome c family protein